MSRPSRSVYTVTRSTYLPDVEMSDFAYIDVDDDDDSIGSDLNSTSSSVKPATGSLYEAKHHVSDHQRDLSERGVFDYFSSPLTLGGDTVKRSHEPSFRPPNHCYLGPGGSSLRSSGAKKFVEAHRQAGTTTSSDEEAHASGAESHWYLSSGGQYGAHDSLSMDVQSQWVKEQYNQHVKRTNTMGYDEAVLCDDGNNCSAENRPPSPVSGKQADPADMSTSCASDSQHVLSRHSDTSSDICDSLEHLRLITEANRTLTLHGDPNDLDCETYQRSGLPAQKSFLMRPSGKTLKDVGDTASLSSLGQPWPVLGRSTDSYAGSHQNAVCRSSELSPTVVSAVGSVRCSTGVDTGVGFPLSTVSSRSSKGQTDVSRLSSSVQSTVTSGTRWRASNGSDRHRQYEGCEPRSQEGRSSRYDHATHRKNSPDDDRSGPYGSRGNDSDGDDSICESRRSDTDMMSNVDILRYRGGKDYDSGPIRPYIGNPQYQLIDEDEMDRRQMGRGQALEKIEKMRRKRNKMLNRQMAGVTKADTVPGFRGEAPLEELISYIDAPALTTPGDGKTVRKSKKKKSKKVQTAPALDSASTVSIEKLANSCEVFVGMSGTGSDEPSIRVGDSCCIEFRKKSDGNGLLDTGAVDTDVHLPGCGAYVDSAEGDRNGDGVSENIPADSDASHLDVTLTEDLPEVVYADVPSAVLEVENLSRNCMGPVTSETPTVSDVSVGFLELGEVADQTALKAQQLYAESSESTKVAESADTLSAENSCETVGDKQLEVDSVLLLTGSDSVTSDTGSLEDLFVTVQKKKRTKNPPAISSEDPRHRFGHRSKGVEDRDSSFIKRSWVRSSDASSSIVPSVNVCRSSIVYSKPSCPVTQRNGVVVAQYSQASNPDRVLVSTAGKFQQRLAVSVEGRNTATPHNGKGEPVVKDSACMLSDVHAASTVCITDGDVKKECAPDVAVGSGSPLEGIVTACWQLYDPKFPAGEYTDKTDFGKLSDMPMDANDVTIFVDDNVQQISSDDVSKLRECDIETVNQSPITTVVSEQDSCGDDQSANIHSTEQRVRSPTPLVHSSSSSDVFLDTRNIAGTTPPRCDISFGFDPSCSPKPSDISAVQQHVSLTPDVLAVSSHCPAVVAPIPPAVAGCPPVLYFYPTLPVTILPTVATFPTGRCTPVGVVPPMPAVADASGVTVPPPTWQSADNKLAPVPVTQDVQSVIVDHNSFAASDDSMATNSEVLPPTSSKAANEFVLYAAQRYLYSEFEKVLESSRSSLPHECLVVHYSSLEAVQNQQ